VSRNAPLSRSPAPVCALLCLAASLHAGGAGGGEVRVAIIGGEGERAPSEAVLAALEVGLSREDALVPVERRRVREVLTELKLGARGLAEPGTVAKVGRLLSADLMAFVERLPGGVPKVVRVSTVETKSGITLGSDIGLEDSFARDASHAIRTIKSSATKFAVPEAERRYVGILGFRSAELGRSLEGRAEAMGMLLATDLASSPNVVMLEREHLEQLGREEMLSGAELRLRSSTVLVEGTLRRARGGKEFDVSVTVRPLAKSGAPRSLAVSIPSSDLVAGRQTLVTAILRALRAGAGERVSTDPEREAALFIARCRALESHGELESAVRAAEAAFALDPDQDTRLAAAQARNRLAFGLRSKAILANRYGKRLIDAPTEIKLRMLSCLLRERSLRYDLYRRHELRRAEGRETSARLPRIVGEAGPFRVAARAGESSVRRLAGEIDRLGDDIARFLLKYHAEGWPDLHAQNEWWRALTWHMAGQIHWRSSDVREWARRFKEVVTLWETPPGPCHPQNRYRLPSMLGACFEYGGRERFVTPEDRKVVVETLKWMTTRDDPLVRLTAHLAKLAFGGRRDLTSAKAALDIVRDELPLGHPDRLPETNPGRLGLMLIPAVEAISDPGKRARRCGEIVGPMLDVADATALLMWDRIIAAWAGALQKQGRVAEARRVYARAISVLSAGDGGHKAANIKSMKAWLEGKLARLPPSREDDASPANAWSDYRIARIDVGGPPAKGAKLVDGLVVGRRLVLVWVEMPPLGRDGKRRQTAESYVTASSIAGGARSLIGKASVKESPGVHKHQVLDVATDGNAVYVAANRGGLAVFRRGRGKVWTEKEGLPAGGIHSVACYGGKVYLGVGGYHEASGLIEFDPRRRSFKILASSRTTGRRSALDGGEPYVLRGLLADPARKCIWFGVSAEDGSERVGLWRCFPGTGRLEHFWKTADSFDIRSMLLKNGKILLTDSSLSTVEGIGTLVLVDPDTDTKTWLAGSWRPSNDCGRAPVYERAGGGMWPLAVMGEHLITGDGVLRLHTKQKGSTVLDRASDGPGISEIVLVRACGDCVLAGSESGDVWRIQRTPGMGEAAKRGVQD